MNAQHPGSVQAAMKARFDSLQELLDGMKARLAQLDEKDGDQIDDAVDYYHQTKDEQQALLRAYEVYTGATWLDVQRFFGLTKKDES